MSLQYCAWPQALYTEHMQTTTHIALVASPSLEETYNLLQGALGNPPQWSADRVRKMDMWQLEEALRKAGARHYNCTGLSIAAKWALGRQMQPNFIDANRPA